MKIGFAKTDITPRVGVELCGFGPFLNRHSIGVRDRLWARAMAVEHDGQRAVIVSCDLVGVRRALTHAVRARVADAAGVAPEAVMVHGTHTHSGPNTVGIIGWGDEDPPYLEILPTRIAAAAIEAVKGLREGILRHAEVPCEGIGQNREYDRDALPLCEVLADDWRPLKPELTDTTCHVVTAEADGKLLGFFSYFGCHPVVCCETTRYIHGDYAGVAGSLLERESPGAVGLFLQGAQGDVNSCVVHKPEADAMPALEIVAARYATAVRAGLRQATPLAEDPIIRPALRTVRFSRKDWGTDRLRELLAGKEATLHAASASDSDRGIRMEMVYILALRGMLDRAGQGKSLVPESEIQAIRIGPLTLLGAPFEIFQAIKNDVRKAARSRIPLVMGITNDLLGYAPDRTAAARGGYAADMVPLMLGELPFANIHDELVTALLDLEKSVA